LGTDLEPTVVAFLQKMKLPSAAGLKVCFYPDLRWKRCDIKSNSLLANVIAREAAQVKGCDEALLEIENGEILEGSSTNYFIVKKNVVYTTPLSEAILPGVTRKFCLQVLQEIGLRVVETSLSRKDILSADEVWISSSTKDIVWVQEVEGHIITHQPGLLFDKIQKAFSNKKMNSLKIPFCN
jgi:D-alanine transaminase